MNSISIFLDMLKAGFTQELYHEYNRKTLAELVSMKIHFILHNFHCPFYSFFFLRHLPAIIYNYFCNEYE